MSRRSGYVVYEDTRRASAGRRLEKTMKALREAGFAAQGFVVETGPVQAVKDAIAQLEPKVDEIVISTHPAERSGWMRRNVVEDVERAAQGIPVTHVVAGEDEGGRNVLVIANQTVVSPELLGRIRARAAQGEVSFLIVSPQSDGEQHDEADRRLRRALSELRGEGIDVHGQVVHPDPYTAARQAVARRARRRDHRLDVPGRALRLAAQGPRRAPAQGHGDARRARRLRQQPGAVMTAVAEEHHGPPPIHYSSRVSPSVLGMFLFIASEIMLFGSFFTVYFFDRVVNHPFGGQWPPPGFHRPAFVAGVNTLHPRDVERHDALGRHVDQEREPRGAPGGARVDVLLGLAFLLTQVVEYHRIGFNTSDTSFAATFFGLTGLHGAHVLVGLSILTVMMVRAFSGPLLARAPPRRRDRRHLLALRRRDVDRRVRDRLPPLGSTCGTRSGARPTPSASSG